METVIRIAIVYFFLMLCLRVLGKREFGQLAPFDLVTLLLIPEIVQQAIVGEDFSMTNALIGLSTLFVLVYLTSLVSYRNKKLGQIIEGRPTVLVSRGRLVPANLNLERVSPDEIYGEMHHVGLASLDQVQWGILEADGKISFVPSEPADKQVRTRQPAAG